ncbi:MAG TPA: metalloregulator ArsR/SmtB family transcription factor [Bacillales bacterium]|nr:metalloregulator ArsR/SmtB family transcription factor [Bacillales bacterium]
MLDEHLTEVFKALAHSVRRTILDLLTKGPMTTGELSSHFREVSRYAVMKHLKTLEDANLVVTRKKGRERYNYLNIVPLQEMKRRWLNGYDALAADTLLNIKKISEEENAMESSFDIEQEVKINVSRKKVFHALTENIEQWWSERLFEDSVMTVEPKLGGTFVEKCEDGKAALWGTITYLDPEKELWLDGVLGMPGPVKSFYKYTLETSDDETTILKLSHSAVGPHVDEVKEDYQDGWKKLLGTKLKDFLEK